MRGNRLELTVKSQMERKELNEKEADILTSYLKSVRPQFVGQRRNGQK